MLVVAKPNPVPDYDVAVWRDGPLWAWCVIPVDANGRDLPSVGNGFAKTEPLAVSMGEEYIRTVIRGL